MEEWRIVSDVHLTAKQFEVLSLALLGHKLIKVRRETVTIGCSVSV